MVSYSRHCFQTSIDLEMAPGSFLNELFHLPLGKEMPEHFQHHRSDYWAISRVLQSNLRVMDMAKNMRAVI